MYQYRLCVEQYRFKQAKLTEQTRFITYQIYCALTDQKDRVSMQEYHPIYTDVLQEKEPEKEVTREDILRMQNEALRRLEIINKVRENA